MIKDSGNLARRVQEGTVSSARAFLGASLGRLRDGLAGDRSQLEDLERQLAHEDTRAHIRELIDSCSAIEASIAEAARNLGLEDEAEEPSGRSQDADGRDDCPSSGQADRAVSGVLDTAANGVGDAVGTGSEVVDEVVGQVGQVLSPARRPALGTHDRGVRPDRAAGRVRLGGHHPDHP